MKDWNIKGIKAATFVRGYFFDKELPDEVKKAIHYICEEYETLIKDANRIIEADWARQEMERAKKRADREEKKNGVSYSTETVKINPHASIDDGGNISLSIPKEKDPIIERVLMAELPEQKQHKSRSEEARKAVSERMKARHAAIRAQNQAIPAGEA